MASKRKMSNKNQTNVGCFFILVGFRSDLKRQICQQRAEDGYCKAVAKACSMVSADMLAD